MQQKKEKATSVKREPATKRPMSKTDLRVAESPSMMGNIFGTNIPLYSTVRQNSSLWAGRAPEFCLVECYSSRAILNFHDSLPELQPLGASRK
jgi:hypothetical protein